jgi:hypothetical protein
VFKLRFEKIKQKRNIINSVEDLIFSKILHDHHSLFAYLASGIQFAGFQAFEKHEFFYILARKTIKREKKYRQISLPIINLVNRVS